MKNNILRLIPICLFALCILTETALAISIEIGSSDGGGRTSLQSTFILDPSANVMQDISISGGTISSNLEASGSGSNRISQSLSGNDYCLNNNIKSQGTLSVSSTTSAEAQSASLSQDVTGKGDVAVNLAGNHYATSAGQESSVAKGTLSSQQSIYAGECAYSTQSTVIKGQSGKVTSGALGENNVVVAESSFSGDGSLVANLGSAASKYAYFGGSAKLDETTILNAESFNSVSPNSNNQIMGTSGLRMLGDESTLGSFSTSVLNMGLTGEKGASTSSKVATTAKGGSYTSYKLTGFRWNKKDPKVQLYLNPANTPSGLSAYTTQQAITLAANAWDNAVSSNLFADGTTVKIDSKKVVDDPFSARPKRDGYSVHGWKKFSNCFVAYNRWWSNGAKVGGYYSLTESDTWYNLNYQWTTSMSVAQSTRKVDLISVSLHELGHSIGLDDIYSSKYGGTLSPKDPRTNDYDQVMNLYNGPQRTLGNGDKYGVQKLYGK
jgi:hypothetical protein